MTMKPQHYVELKRHGVTTKVDLDLRDYIMLNEQGIYVSQKKFFHSQDNEQMHTSLYDEEARMPLLPEFRLFYCALQSGKAFDGLGEKLSPTESHHLFSEFAEKRDPWRAERLDAQFTYERKRWYVSSLHKPTIEGLVATMKEELDLDTLMEDRGIELTSLNFTTQGLPRCDISEGSILYWYPQHNSVARFGAGSGRAYLGCNGDSGYSPAALGVRKVYSMKKVQKDS